MVVISNRSAKQRQEGGRVMKVMAELVGRESEAHPAFSIIPSLDFERYDMRSFKIINACSYFGQKFPSAFQQREREKERTARNKSGNILRQKLSLTQLSKAGCVSLSRPTATA
jgi:hypothetical protein